MHCTRLAHDFKLLLRFCPQYLTRHSKSHSPPSSCHLSRPRPYAGSLKHHLCFRIWKITLWKARKSQAIHLIRWLNGATRLSSWHSNQEHIRHSIMKLLLSSQRWAKAPIYRIDKIWRQSWLVLLPAHILRLNPHRTYHWWCFCSSHIARPSPLVSPKYLQRPTTSVSMPWIDYCGTTRRKHQNIETQLHCKQPKYDAHVEIEQPWFASCRCSTVS